MTYNQDDRPASPAVKPEKIVPFKTHQGRRKGKPRAKSFTIVINEVLDDHRLSPGAKLCYVFLRRRKNKEGTCWPTKDQLGKDCGVKERMISTRINELKARGYLDWQHFHDSYGQLRNRYIFTDPETVSQQQCIAAGQQQCIAVNQVHNTLIGVTNIPPIPETDKIEEDSVRYGSNRQ